MIRAHAVLNMTLTAQHGNFRSLYLSNDSCITQSEVKKYYMKRVLHLSFYPQQNDLGINCLKYTNAFSVVVAFLFWTDDETPELNVMKTPWNAVLKSNQLRVDWRWTKRCTAKNNAIFITLSVAFFGIVVQQFNVVILLNIYSHVHHDYFPHSTNHRINLSVFMPYIPG